MNTTRLCPAAYDEPQAGDRVEAHNCGKALGHDGVHTCDLCGTTWTARAGVRELAPQNQEQVQTARQDAVNGGVGIVLINHVGGKLVYRRLDPDQVVLRPPKQR